MRDIDALLSNLSKIGEITTWFIRADYKDQQGRTYPYYQITRDGFVLLVMGFTGPEALQFQVAYIERFNEMERRLNGHAAATTVKAVEGHKKRRNALATARELVRLDDERKAINKRIRLLQREFDGE